MLSFSLTFAHLLARQIFGIAQGYIDLEPDATEAGGGGSSGTAKTQKHELNSNDPLYANIRNLNFGEIGALLNQLARGVSDGYEERHQAQTVSQVRP